LQFTDRETEGDKEGFEKGKCIFVAEKGKETYLLLFCKEAKYGQ
jgi:hypothetical protein